MHASMPEAGRATTPVGSAASILMSGLRPLAAMAMPEIMPPPETGTMIASRSGTCSGHYSRLATYVQPLSLSLGICSRVGEFF
jgi:hypothetical protein